MEADCDDHTISNRFGEIYDRSFNRVVRLSDLRQADHVAFYRQLLDTSGRYWHHAIIERVDLDSASFTVINFQQLFGEVNNMKLVDAASFRSDSMGNLTGGVVQRSVIDWNADVVYRIQYEPTQCLVAHDVIEKARSHVGQTNYSLLRNNCEHFAYLCKTGKRWSQQTRTLRRLTTKYLMTAGARGLACRFGSTAGRHAVRFTCRHGLKASFLVGAAVEVAFTVRDINAARRKKDLGVITSQQCQTAVTKRTSVAVGDVTMATVAGAIGAGIAGTTGLFVGGLIGGAVGSLLGSSIVKRRLGYKSPSSLPSPDRLSVSGRHTRSLDTNIRRSSWSVRSLFTRSVSDKHKKPY